MRFMLCRPRPNRTGSTNAKPCAGAAQRRRMTKNKFCCGPVGVFRVRRNTRLKNELDRAEFPRQQMAFDFGDKIALKCATFSYQPAQLQGAQRYVVTNYDSFWTRYCALPAEQRHFYEVIKSGCVASACQRRASCRSRIRCLFTDCRLQICTLTWSSASRTIRLKTARTWFRRLSDCSVSCLRRSLERTRCTWIILWTWPALRSTTRANFRLI